jgi:hypothetical protein
LRWLVGAVIAFALLYATGINRNLFFLAFGLSCTIVAIVVGNDIARSTYRGNHLRRQRRR